MVNYSNGKIYKIVPTNGDDICYIGSTTKQYLSQRMDSHRTKYKNWQKNNKIEKASSVELFEKYGVENCKIVLIENFPCNTKDELEKREGEYIKTLNCINKRGAGGVSISGMVGKVRENIETDINSVLMDDNISVLSTDTTIISINYQSDNEPEIEIPHSPIGGLNPQTGKPLPSREELIEIMNKYEKYQHLFPAIKRQMKWQEANRNIDMQFYIRRHNTKMKYILFKIALLKCDSPIN